MLCAERLPENDCRSCINGSPHREPLPGRVVEGHARVEAIFAAKEERQTLL